MIEKKNKQQQNKLNSIDLNSSANKWAVLSKVTVLFVVVMVGECFGIGCRSVHPAVNKIRSQRSIFFGRRAVRLV